MGENGRRRIKTADRVFEIINFIQSEEGATLTEIAANLGLSKSTVHEYVYTLLDHGYLVRDEATYHVGLQFLEHGFSARERYQVLQYVEQPLEFLAERTGEAVWIMVEEHNQVVYLENSLGQNAVQTHARIGSREYMHCTAGGKAILSTWSEERLDEMIASHGLPAYTDNTITDREALLQELNETRDRKYAINNEETTIGEKAIAAPIRRDDAEYAQVAIVIAGPARRIDRKLLDEDIGDILLDETEEIELRVNWDLVD